MKKKIHLQQPNTSFFKNLMFFVLFLGLLYFMNLYYYTKYNKKGEYPPYSSTSCGSSLNVFSSLSPFFKDTFNDPYSPPFKQNDAFRIPINIQTQNPCHNVGGGGGGCGSNYAQMGILVKERGEDNPLILPIFGKKTYNHKDKYQYYAISNTGTLNTKLPVKYKGKNCSCENGCDEIYNGDKVYVEGYGDVFKATIYKNETFAYIPI